MTTATPPPLPKGLHLNGLRSERILDEAYEAFLQQFNGLFWNSPPTCVIDRDQVYRLPFSVLESPQLVDITKESLQGCMNRFMRDILKKISLEVGHSDSFALGPNLHTLVFRYSELPTDEELKAEGIEYVPCGRIAGRSTPSTIALIRDKIVVRYAVDRFSAERFAIQKFKDVVR